MTAPRLDIHPIHLGPEATALPQPAFTGGAWYDEYIERHGCDGAGGRLVTEFTFDESWTSWEMHPAGDEVVWLVEGEVVLVQEFADGHVERTPMHAGEYAINPPGVWHTMDLESVRARALFITAGIGTQHRER